VKAIPKAEIPNFIPYNLQFMSTVHGRIPVGKLDHGSMQYRMFQRLGESDNDGDVVFHIDKEHFYAHQLFVKQGSAKLRRLIEENKSGSPITIEIANVQPDVFRELLAYIYIGKVEANLVRELLPAAHEVS